MGIRRSMLGKMENVNRRGVFMFTFEVWDVAFPEKYPRGRCPTVNIVSLRSVILRSIYDVESIS